MENDELKDILESDPSQSSLEIAVDFGVIYNNKTVLIHLKQNGEVKKLEGYSPSPHELTAVLLCLTDAIIKGF